MLLKVLSNTIPKIPCTEKESLNLYFKLAPENG